MTNKEFYVKLLQGIDNGDFIAYVPSDDNVAPELWNAKKAPQFALMNSLSAEESWELMRLPNQKLKKQ